MTADYDKLVDLLKGTVLNDGDYDPVAKQAAQAITELREEVNGTHHELHECHLTATQWKDRAEAAEKERAKMQKAIKFFLEDGVAEDSPDLDQAVYASLAAAIQEHRS